MTVFVTGASGHLGGNVVRQLLAAGHRVRVLCRPQSPNAAIEGLDVERVDGDLGRVATLKAALEGCDALIHLAAMVSIRAIDQDAMVATNVTATRNLMTAAMAAGVRRVVHCSSIGTIGRREDGEADEELFPSPFEIDMPYDRTKLHAELEVLRAAAQGLHVCILNPSGLIGPHDYKPSLIGQTILEFARGRMPAYVRGGYDFVPVTDVARAHLLALERGRPGQRYILSGEHVELGQILAWLSELTGQPVPRWVIPPELLLPIARVKDWFERTLTPERVPRFTRHSIALLQRPKYPSSRRAREELGWTPGSVRDALTEAVQWFRERGDLPTAPAVQPQAATASR